MLGWLSHSEDRPDVKINVIYPATDVHIRKVIHSFHDLQPEPESLKIPPLFCTVLQAAGPHRSRNARVIRTHRKAIHRRFPSVAYPMVGFGPSTLSPSHPSLIDSSVFLNT